MSFLAERKGQLECCSVFCVNSAKVEFRGRTRVRRGHEDPHSRNDINRKGHEPLKWK